MHDNGTALLVSDEQPTDATVPTVSGEHNVIAGNGYGVRNTSAALLNLAHNWWGDASGPSDWSIGTGDSVSANVRFFPWSTNAQFSASATCMITGTNGPDVLSGTSGNDKFASAVAVFLGRTTRWRGGLQPTEPGACVRGQIHMFRGILLPARRTVGGRSAWDWSGVETWKRMTRRLETAWTR